MTYIYIYICKALNIYIYGMHICKYGNIYPFELTKLYVYIYMQCKTLEHRIQVIGTIGSCRQHGLTI